MPPHDLSNEQNNDVSNDWHEFINALSKHGNVTAAAACYAGLSRSRVYRLCTQDEEFAQAWDAALDEATDQLANEAMRRALDVDMNYAKDISSRGFTITAGAIGLKIMTTSGRQLAATPITPLFAWYGGTRDLIKASLLLPPYHGFGVGSSCTVFRKIGWNTASPPLM